MYKVFTDFHHSGLLNSLILLFEKRLGGQVYRPIGREWWEKGFWKIYDHPATVEQYLGIGGNTPDGTPKLNEVIPQNPGDKIEQFGTMWTGTYKCQDIDSGYYNKAITFDAFMRGKFDIVIASIPDHIEPFKRLCELHPNHPKLIFQIGNAWTTEAGLAPNVMASANITGVPSNINFITYHQEFDLDIFKPGNVRVASNLDKMTFPKKNIYSFVNCFDTAGHFAQDWELFRMVEKNMPDWSFKAYGGQCRDGAAHGSAQVAEKMLESRFVWHTKAGGDGYGHVIHNAPAVAKPLIVKKQYYAGKLAEPLLIDGETCICIDGLDYQQVIHKIEYYSDHARYSDLCEKAYNNFKKVVDFDQEEKEIRAFLSRLL